MTDAGWKQSAIWLPPEAVTTLEQLCQLSGDLTRQDMICRLILEAGETPITKTRKKKKAAKKKSSSRKKKTAAQKPTPVKLDAMGLARAVGFIDFPSAVSVRAEIKDYRMMERMDWRDLPYKFMAVWEAEKHLSDFKKTHTEAKIKQRYKTKDKTLIEVTATYSDERPDHRVVYQARGNNAPA